MGAGKPFSERIDAVIAKAVDKVSESEENIVPRLGTKEYITTRPYRLVHATNSNMPIRPYKASLQIPALLPDQTIVAVGQSRHLGGGLLVPGTAPNSGRKEEL